jgi:hypothetical protein
MNTVREIQDVLGRGPVAGLFGLMLAAIVVLFVLLMRSLRRETQRAVQIIPLAEKMLAAEAVVGSYIEILDHAAMQFGLTKRLRKKFDPDAPTQNMRLPKKTTGGGGDGEGGSP